MLGGREMAVSSSCTADVYQCPLSLDMATDDFNSDIRSPCKSSSAELYSKHRMLTLCTEIIKYTHVHTTCTHNMYTHVHTQVVIVYTHVHVLTSSNSREGHIDTKLSDDSLTSSTLSPYIISV